MSHALWAINKAKHLDGYGKPAVVSFPAYKTWIGLFSTLCVIGQLVAVVLVPS